MRTQRHAISVFVGAQVDAERVRAGLSKAALARTGRMANTTLKRSLTGVRAFTITELIGIGHALNLPASAFMPDMVQARAFADADSRQTLADIQAYFDAEDAAAAECAGAEYCPSCLERALTR